MLLIRVKNFSKQVGDKVLFDNIGFLIHNNDKIGLVGKNGSGKTTLLDEIYSNNGLKEAKNLRIGYLKQQIDSNSKALEFILGIANPNDWFDSEINQKRTKLNKLLEKIKLDPSLLERNLESLSGGEKTKVFILKVMLQKPELLILDEPTNHLDLTGINYLTNWLNEEYSGAFIVVSHNRDFLNKVTNRIFEIFNLRLNVFKGDYDYYVQKQNRTLEKQKAAFLDFKKEETRINKSIQEKKQIINSIGISGRGSYYLDKAKKVDNSIKNLVARKTLKESQKPYEDTEKINLSEFDIEKSYNEVLTLKNIGYKSLFAKLNLELRRGDRACIIGDTGCGKTTLFRLITNELKSTNGIAEIGKNVIIGYLKQNVDKKDVLIWDYLKESCKTQREQDLRDYLGKFLFRKNDVYKKLSELSGGELTRLELLKLILNKCNFLLLDEPTNNLDLDSIETLESALTTYPGTILFISHDIQFINNLGAEVYELTKDGLLNKRII